MAVRVRESGGRPAPRRDEKPKPALDRKPEPRPTQRPEGRPNQPAPRTAGRPAEASREGRGNESHTRPARSAGASTAVAETADAGKGLIFQQEVDVLRGQVSELHVVSLFSPTTAPRVAGVYGRLLQGLDAGVSFRDAFANLNHAAAATRNNSAHILSLVRNHKTPTFGKPKGK